MSDTYPNYSVFGFTIAHSAASALALVSSMGILN